MEGVQRRRRRRRRPVRRTVSRRRPLPSRAPAPPRRRRRRRRLAGSAVLSLQARLLQTGAPSPWRPWPHAPSPPTTTAPCFAPCVYSSLPPPGRIATVALSGLSTAVAPRFRDRLLPAPRGPRGPCRLLTGAGGRQVPGPVPFIRVIATRGVSAASAVARLSLVGRFGRCSDTPPSTYSACGSRPWRSAVCVRPPASCDGATVCVSLGPARSGPKQHWATSAYHVMELRANFACNPTAP